MQRVTSRTCLSLAAIWCTDPVSMIISRAACGVGAALIMPTTLSLITTGVPADKRELGISIWAAVVGAGAIFGILITGVLLEFFSWKSIFIMFAVMAVTILVLSLTIATSKDPDPGPFDFIGALTSVAAVTMLIFGLIEAPHKGWTSPLVLVSNEIGLGVMPMSAEARACVDALGHLHQAVAAHCARVTLMVAGCELPVKDAR